MSIKELNNFRNSHQDNTGLKSALLFSYNLLTLYIFFNLIPLENLKNILNLSLLHLHRKQSQK